MDVYNYTKELTSICEEVKNLCGDGKCPITTHYSEVRHLPKVGQCTSEYTLSDGSYFVISSVRKVGETENFHLYEVFSTLENSKKPWEEHFLWFLCTRRRK